MQSTYVRWKRGHAHTAEEGSDQGEDPDYERPESSSSEDDDDDIVSEVAPEEQPSGDPTNNRGVGISKETLCDCSWSQKLELVPAWGLPAPNTTGLRLLYVRAAVLVHADRDMTFVLTSIAQARAATVTRTSAATAMMRRQPRAAPAMMMMMSSMSEKGVDAFFQAESAVSRLLHASARCLADDGYSGSRQLWPCIPSMLKVCSYCRSNSCCVMS